METTQEQQTESQNQSFTAEHPWLEIPDVDMDEEIRYSLDEIRFA